MIPFFRALTVASLSAVFVAGVPSADLYAASRQKRTHNTQTKKASAGKRRSNTGSSKPNNSAATKSAARKRANPGPKSSAEARRLQEAAQRDIAQTKEKIRLNDRQIKEGLADLNQLSSEIKTGRLQVATLQKKVAGLQGQISAINGSIAQNEAELQRMRAEYLKAVKKMRLNRKKQSMLAFIFASDDFNQALRRMRYIRQFSEWKQEKSNEINRMTETLSAEREKLDQTKKEHSISLGKLSSSQASLEAKHKKQAEIVEGLKQNGSALQAHLANKQSEANQLKSAIANLIAQEQAKAEAERRAREEAARKKAEDERIAREKAEAERLERERVQAARPEQEKNGAGQAAAQTKAEKKKAEDERKAREKKLEAERKAAEKKRKEEEKKERKERKARKKNSRAKSDSKMPARESGSVGKPDAAEPSGFPANFAALKGKLRRPVDGAWRVTNPFGKHAMPELPQVVYDNPGIDAEVAKGSSVKAVAGGRVSGVYKLSGYGNVVIVSHGDYYTVYGNLSSVSVVAGNRLSPGQTVGAAAADPDDPRRGSVHFEVWHGREKQNPEAWIK